MRDEVQGSVNYELDFGHNKIALNDKAIKRLLGFKSFSKSDVRLAVAANARW